MSRAVYADNFRGLNDTLVELEGIVFLVGENSSGKSSLLALSHILSGEEFWFRPDFNKAGHDLGGFSELRTRSSRRPEFTVGYSIFEATGQSPFGAVLSLKDVEDIPVPARCTYLLNGSVVTFQQSERHIWWTTKKLKRAAEGSSTDLLKELVSAHRKFNVGQAAKLPIEEVQENLVLITVPALIQREIEKSGQESRSIRSILPWAGLERGVWFSPVRAEPQAVYQTANAYEFAPDGKHAPHLLKDILQRRKSEQRSSITRMLEMFGSESGLFDSLGVKSFSKDPRSPFSVSVKLRDQEFRMSEVGYGVSQAFPFVLEILANSSQGGFYVQQPEVHLHPRAQAAVANILYVHASFFPTVPLVVETHSDYLVDRLRSLIREDFIQRSKDIRASILWHERIGNANVVKRIPIQPDGHLANDVPSAYREFFIKESMRGLGLNVDN